MRCRGVVVGLALVVAAAAAASAASRSETRAGTLDLRMAIGVVSDGVPCPPNAPAEANCFARNGSSAVAGLGRVTEEYVWAFTVGPPTCPANLAKPRARTGRFVVAGKGDIDFALADGATCVDVEPVRNEPQDFTITGGTGPFAGASGSGRVERALGGGAGTETWTGTLVVEGLTFDVTAPTLAGARSKTVRAPKGAKTTKVTYKVTATDDVDGSVPVACAPKSDSRFKLGKTTVRCSATDASANTAKASFTVIVKRR